MHLSITALATGAERQRIRLPKGLDYCRPKELMWLPGGQSLVLLCGCAWALGPLQGELRAADRSAPADLLFVDLRASSCTHVKLPPQRRLLLTGHPVHCAVSCDDRVVVLHTSRTAEACLSIFTSSGSPGASTAVFPLNLLAESDSLQPSHLIWAPSCETVAFILATTDTTEARTLCVWRPSASEADSLNSFELSHGLEPDGAGQLLFSPCSSRLLVQFNSTIAVLWCIEDNEEVVVPQLRGHACSAWSMSALVSLCPVGEEQSLRSSKIMVGRGLRWSEVQDDEVQPCLSIDLRSRVTELSAATCSPDGLHCAVVSWRLQVGASRKKQRALKDPRLELVSATAGRLFWVPLGTVPEDRTWIATAKGREGKVMADPTWTSYHLQWAPDGSALRCSFHSGEEHLLVSFV